MAWTDEQREDVIYDVVEGMIAEMTLEQLRQQCWDRYYEELICMEDFTLEELMSRYAPHRLD
jgi:hypothetical protein